MGIESYNSSASLNTTLGGKNIAEGMARGDVSDSIRQLMADIAQGVVPTVNVKTYGAVGDGVTNDRTAFATAIAAARGKRLIVPEGNYLIDTTAGPITLEEVSVVGEGPLDGATAAIDQGTNFYITGTANAPFKVRRGVTVENCGFYYPNQADTAAPTSYPPVFQFDFTNGAVQFVTIRNNVVYNAYKFVDIGDTAGAVGHVGIENNYVFAINRAIYIRRNVEHVRIRGNNFTFGHWLAATEAGVRSYYRANATILEIAESDGVEIIDNLFFGALNGILTSGFGLCQFMNISLNKIDQCRYGIKAAGPGNLAGFVLGNIFNSYNAVDTSLDGRAIDIQTAGSAEEPLTIANNSFLISTTDHVFISGNSALRRVNVVGNVFRNWAAYKAAGSYGAVNASGAITNIIVSNNSFAALISPGRSYGVTGSPNTAVISGNTFESCQAPLSLTTNSLTASANVSFVTGGTTSDVISATSVYQSGNSWDKPSTTSTKPAFLARKSDAQVFNSGSATDVTWGTETFDKGSNFATPSFTAPVAGRYRFDLNLMHDASGTAGDRWTITIQPGTATRLERSYKMIADFDSVSINGVLELAAGETVKVQITRSAGAGTFTIQPALADNWFSGHLVE